MLKASFDLRGAEFSRGDFMENPYSRAAGLALSPNYTPAPSSLPNLSTASTLRGGLASWAKRGMSKAGLGGWNSKVYNIGDQQVLSDGQFAPALSQAINTGGGNNTPTKWSIDNKLGAVGLGINAVNALAGIVGLGYNIYATNEQLKMARANQKLARQQFETENARYNAREAERIEANKKIAASAQYFDANPMQRE